MVVVPTDAEEHERTAQVETFATSEIHVPADGPDGRHVPGHSLLPKWDRVLLGLAFLALAIALAVGLT